MELKRIVNIMPDDKFLDYYIEMSERFLPQESSYLFFKNDSIFKYIKSENENIITVSEKEIISHELIESLKKADKIIFHSFRKEYKNLIDKVSGTSELIWFFWGFDGYITQKKNNYLGKLTSKLRYEKSLKGNLKYLKNRFYNDNKINEAGKIHRDIIRKINYCATWVEGDFDLAKTINPELKRLYFNYYTEELMNFPAPEILNPNLGTIMLGNSGSEYNNHAEALLYLNKIRFQGKIYCPLSYNGSAYYKYKVEEMGSRFFGKNFIPLKDLIPLEEYQKIINSCDVVWMNHKRQQAAGNLFAAFYAGKIIVLDKDNPMVSTFRNWGLKVFEKEILIDKKFDRDELQKNQKIKSLITIDKNNDFFNFLKK